MEKVGGDESGLVVGRVLELTIDSIAYGGDGIGKIAGKAIFVPFSSPGDTVRVRIAEDKGRFANAELLEVLKPSALRVAPQCPIYGSCGGCDVQHIAYDEQLEQKRLMISDAVNKALGDAPTVEPVVPSPDEYHYRTRARLRYRRSGDSVELGYFSRSSHTMVPLSHCPVLVPQLNDLIDRLINSFPKGIKDDEGEIDLYLDAKGIPKFSPPGASGFAQVNDGVNEHLKTAVVSAVTDYAGRKGGQLAVLDLYCGDGNLSIPLIPVASRIFGTDLAAKSIRLANAAAEKLSNEHVNVRYSREPVDVTARKTAMQGRRYDVVIVDPPRSGLGESASTIIGLGIPFVVYVSCVPPILGKDLQAFCAAGYRVLQITPLDMFPQTHHVEVVAILEKG